jgi:hypothetical protein
MNSAFMYLTSAVKFIVFKDSDTLDPGNLKFDSLKFSIFIFILLATWFNVYAIKYISKQATELSKLNEEKILYVKAIKCINKKTDEVAKRVSLLLLSDSELLIEIQKCTEDLNEIK